ncbi:Mu transposase C-terminal domain-containing protein [Streptomyces chrestomyceticus]|uniref:Mu transposase C-terminal domain-containing protein n=1 Tax=Streptomyces chrestomyceticus TaxID=68185 RepID=UPI0033C7100B
MPDSPTPRPVDDRELRAASITRLLHLQATHQLTPGHIRTVADSFGRHPKTIRRWMANASHNDGRYTPRPRPRAILSPTMHTALARWCGNIAGAYHELRQEGYLGEKPISYATFHRTVCRELDAGHRAGLRGGEAARRRFDIHLQRPRGHRNEAWEGDHKQADVWVDVDGEPRKPWLTLFADCSSDAVCGLAITPHTPSREAVLVALRDAMLRGPEHGPFGGLPRQIRVDGGKDFLCRTVGQALGAFAVERVDLPPYHPELKGTIEAINGALVTMLFPRLPGYTRRPRANGSMATRLRPGDPLLTFEAFVAEVRTWIHWWNHEHTIRNLGNRTPHQVWQQDPTPIEDVDPAALHTYTLEAPGNTFTIDGNGVCWQNRHYFGPWMNGMVGTEVTVRYLPHHRHTVEVYDAATGRYLGSADLQGQASEEKRSEVRLTRQRSAARLRRVFKRAERDLAVRYAAVTVPARPRRTGAMTEDEADEELRRLRTPQADTPTPRKRPLPAPTTSWAQDPATPTPPCADQTSSSPPSRVRPLPAPSPSWRPPVHDTHEEHS